MDPLNLTLGFKLQFICAYCPRTLTQFLSSVDVHPYPSEGKHVSAGHALHHFLAQDGVAVTGWEPPGRDIRAAGAPPFSQWRVGSVKAQLTSAEADTLPDDYFAEGCELASPKFFFDPENPWQAQLLAVLRVLGQLEAAHKCQFVLNASTGLHVHIGFDRAGLPLRTCKGVLQIAAAHERALDALHASCRLSGRELHAHTSAEVLQPHSQRWGPEPEYPQCAPPSLFLAGPAARAASPLAETMFTRLQVVETVASMGELSALFTLPWRASNISSELDGHASAYNFDSLHADADDLHLDGGASLLRTLEFRQHAGSLDFAEIVAWVLVAAQLVRFAHGADAPTLLRLCVHATNENFGLPALLNAIGCNEQVVRHFSRGDSSDGTTETLGVLPDARAAAAFRLPERLRELRELNEASQEECSSGGAAAESRLHGKRLDNMYGIDAAAGQLRVTDNWLTSMFDDLRRKAARQDPNSTPEAVESCAKYELLGELHANYLCQIESAARDAR